ncbi:MAG: response regulator [Armatimonadetes bacterium]|nr:response regulator [Armatimonadota bacterium]
MSKRILIVDDEPHVLEVIRVTLEDFGFELMEAMDGETVFQIVSDAPPDIILLDVNMPRKDGYQVCSELKQNPSTRHIPVILITVRNQPEDLRTGREAGADGYLTKPFTPLALLSELHEHLKLGVV